MSYKDLEAVVNGQDHVLGIILEVKGSAPRHGGSKIVFDKNKVLSGTIGGGKGEYENILKGIELLNSDSLQFINTVEMVGTDVKGTDMICGGQSKVLLLKIDDEIKDVIQEGLNIVSGGENAVLLYNLQKREVKCFKESEYSFESADPSEYFMEILKPNKKLYIFGGGYVGKSLYEIGRYLDFEITLFDDRSDIYDGWEFYNPKRCISGEYDQLIKDLNFDQSTFCVVTTRGHLMDALCLKNLVNKDYLYLGCIGSRKKVKMVKEELINEGFDPQAVEEIYAPIGLSLGGETPHEISIEILGQIMGVKNGILK